jgi:glycosyltransferase involved in cell wall biosynthesis
MLTASVVICTLDRWISLLKCITSIINQKYQPIEIIVVNGGSFNLLEILQNLFVDLPIRLIYLQSAPCLVRQRNMGIESASGEIVFLFDDDVILERSYIEKILNVYEKDQKGEIGGVQGSIINTEKPRSIVLLYKRFFILSGRKANIYRSGFSDLSTNCICQTRVNVFSGCMMSFRGHILKKYKFDERKYSVYWWGDDADISFRISNKYKLLHIPDAKLIHENSPIRPDGVKRRYRMLVVNHHHLFYLRHNMRPNIVDYFFYVWSELGYFLISCFYLATGKGSNAMLGMLDGYEELIKNLVNRK